LRTGADQRAVPHPRTRITGVIPRRPQVCDRGGPIDWPHSSSKTIHPPRAAGNAQVVANQLLADDPPETWQPVQRLAGLGYDWHNIIHMIASLITEDVYRALKSHREPGPGRLRQAAERATRRLAATRTSSLGKVRAAGGGVGPRPHDGLFCH